MIVLLIAIAWIVAATATIALCTAAAYADRGFTKEPPAARPSRRMWIRSTHHSHSGVRHTHV